MGIEFNYCLPFAGLKSEPTLAIKSKVSELQNLGGPELWQNLHAKIFNELEVLPYVESEMAVKEAEEFRRWKLTADQVLKVGTIYDGKYCNDVVNVFMASLKSLGSEASLGKVFKKNEGGQILVHSLVQTKWKDEDYVVNAGSKVKFWIEKGNLAKAPVQDWVLWRNLAVDQWELGITDARQEKIIMSDARKYYQDLKSVEID